MPSNCMCRTCILAGGPCFTKLMDCCPRCMEYEKIDRDYLECITEFINAKSDEANKKVRLVYQPKSGGGVGISICTGDAEGSRSDGTAWECATAGKDASQEWYKEHSYHLSWAVFNHLPGECAVVKEED